LTVAARRCTYIAVVRTQLYLDDAIHACLRRLSRLQGRTVSDLVRDALVRAYGTAGAEDRLRALGAIEGLWRDRDDLGPTDEYVRPLRRDTHRLLRPKR
jgi:hypothetical protein